MSTAECSSPPVSLAVPMGQDGAPKPAVASVYTPPQQQPQGGMSRKKKILFGALGILGCFTLVLGLVVGLLIGKDNGSDGEATSQNRGGIGETGNTDSTSTPTALVATLSPTTTPTGAPTAPLFVATNLPTAQACPEELAAYLFCLRDLTADQLTDCIGCVENSLQTVENRQTCAGISEGFCPTTIENCPCIANCLVEYTAGANCLTGVEGCVDCTPYLPAESTEAPVAAPALAPVTTPETPVAAGRCNDIEVIYQTCMENAFRGFFDQEACYDCVNAANNAAPQTSCDGYTNAFCPLFRDCNTLCGECLPALQDWFDCSIGGDSCSVDCGELTVIPQSGNATTQCVAPDVAYRACLDVEIPGTFDQNACFDCANEGLTSSTESCEIFTGVFCPLFLQCDTVCDPCMSVLEDWYNCAVGGQACSIDCLGDGEGEGGAVVVTEEPSPAPLCVSEETEYQTCLSSLSSADETACLACANTASENPPRSSCFLFRRYFCTRFNECANVCGLCAPAIEDYTECSFGWDQCDMNCVDFDTDGDVGAPTAVPMDEAAMTTAPVPVPAPEPVSTGVPTLLPISDPTGAPVLAPVTPPTSSTTCPNEEATYLSCLVTENNRDTCVPCVNGVLDMASVESCSLFRRDYCQSDCSTECGACEEVVEDFVDCQVAGPACELDCDAPLSPCLDEEEALETCVDDELEQGCYDCLGTALQLTALLCSNFCTNFAPCQGLCGSCTTQIETWVLCLQPIDDCELSC